MVNPHGFKESAMNKKKTILLLAGIFVILSVAAPLQAQQTTSDLNGTWDFFAYGYYEVFTTYCFGTITVDNSAVTGGSGNYHSAPTGFGGGLHIGEDGDITGSVFGAYDGNSFEYTILSGRLNPDADTIVASGTDQNSWMCIYYFVRVK